MKQYETRSPVLTSLPEAIQCIDLGAVFQEQLHYVTVAFVGTHMKWSQEFLVLFLQRGALPQQGLNNAPAFAAC